MKSTEEGTNKILCVHELKELILLKCPSNANNPQICWTPYQNSNGIFQRNRKKS
jgi:hypothetical protein